MGGVIKYCKQCGAPFAWVSRTGGNRQYCKKHSGASQAVNRYRRKAREKDEEIYKQIKETIQILEENHIKPEYVAVTKDVIDIIMGRTNGDYKVSDFAIPTYDPNLFFINLNDMREGEND